MLSLLFVVVVVGGGGGVMAAAWMDRLSWMPVCVYDWMVGCEPLIGWVDLIHSIIVQTMKSNQSKQAIQSNRFDCIAASYEKTSKGHICGSHPSERLASQSRWWGAR